MKAMVRALRQSADHDDIVLLRGVSWAQFEAILESKGEASVPRLAYFQGDLQLMSPGTNHEEIKTKMARLLEAYAEHLDIVFEGYGSWTVKKSKKKAGLEPDECYIIGAKMKPQPDLALEVIWSSGSIDKLEIYRALSVPEVWFWEEGKILVFVLRKGRYVSQKKSLAFPAFSFELFERCLAMNTQTEAIRAFRKAL